MLKKILKTVGFAFSILVILILLIGLYFTAPSIWRRLVTYPRLEKQKHALQLKYKTPKQYIPLKAFNGILHSHTFWSHDSHGNINEILPAAKKANLDFLFFSDHPHCDQDSFPRSYYGNYDGILIEPGSEKSGLGINPLDTVILDWKTDTDSLIKNVITNGGFVYYIHTEEPHDWENTDYQGMEIYNIHTDIKDEESLVPILINAAITGKKYRHWAFREFFDIQTEILKNWDHLNQTRRITGIGAPDAHNNQNIRARYTADDSVEWVGPNAHTITVKSPGLLEKILLKKTDVTGWAFRWDVDPYECSFHFVNDHVFSDTLTTRAIKNNLVAAHSFVSFDHLADATGFQFFTLNAENSLSAILGDSVKLEQVNTIQAVSPFPVKFELYKNGSLLDFMVNKYSYQFKNNITPGNYRITAYLEFDDQWYPWIYSNNIYIY